MEQQSYPLSMMDYYSDNVQSYASFYVHLFCMQLSCPRYATQCKKNNILYIYSTKEELFIRNVELSVAHPAGGGDQ